MVTQIIIIGGLIAVAVVAFMFKDQIAAALSNAGLNLPSLPMMESGGGGSGGSSDLDVSGNGCACSNGRCIGNCSGNNYAGELPSGMTPMEFVKSKVPGAFSTRQWAYAGRAYPGRRHFVGYNLRGGRAYR